MRTTTERINQAIEAIRYLDYRYPNLDKNSKARVRYQLDQLALATDLPTLGKQYGIAGVMGTLTLYRKRWENEDIAKTVAKRLKIIQTILEVGSCPM